MHRIRFNQTFKIGILANFYGNQEKEKSAFRGEPFRDVSRETLDSVISAIGPQLVLNVKDLTVDARNQRVQLEFNRLADFSRAGVAKQVPSICRLMAIEDELQRQTRQIPAGEFKDDLSDFIVSGMSSFIDSFDKHEFRETSDITLERIWTLLKECEWSTALTSGIVAKTVIRCIRATIEQQIDLVFAQSEFVSLMASWFGLSYLLNAVDDNPNVIVQILDVSREKLQRDFEASAEFDRTAIFDKVFNKAFASPGIAPFSLLVGDFHFTHHPDDINLLREISYVAATCFCPFATAVSPKFFGIKNFSELNNVGSLSDLLRLPMYAGWNAFRESSDANFLALCLPEVIMQESDCVETRPFSTIHCVSRHMKCNAAYLLGAWLGATQTQGGWCVPSTQLDSEPIPVIFPEVSSDRTDGDIVAERTDRAIRDSTCISELTMGVQPFEFSHNGFLPVTQRADSTKLFFQYINSAMKICVSEKTEASLLARQRLLKSFAYIIPLSAICHFIAKRLLGRKFTSMNHYQNFVRELVAQCMTETGKLGQSDFPFSSASVRFETLGFAVPTVVIDLTLGPKTSDPGQVLSIRSNFWTN